MELVNARESNTSKITYTKDKILSFKSKIKKNQIDSKNIKIQKKEKTEGDYERCLGIHTNNKFTNYKTE